MLLLYAIFHWSLSPCTFPVDQNQSRNLLLKALEDNTQIEAFHSHIQLSGDRNPLDIAFMAVAEALLAQEFWSPIKKYEQVVMYREKMAEAVRKDRHNVEIRFLRLIIEMNLPSFLSNEININEDRSFVRKYEFSVYQGEPWPANYADYMFDFFIDYDILTDSERKIQQEQLVPR